MIDTITAALTSTPTLLFASTFIIVFALGMQSQFVNGGMYRQAFFTSFAIGTSNLMILRNIPTTPAEIAAYLCGGPLAIVLAMWVFARWTKRKQQAKNHAGNYKGHVPPHPIPPANPRWAGSNPAPTHPRPQPPNNPPPYPSANLYNPNKKIKK